MNEDLLNQDGEPRYIKGGMDRRKDDETVACKLGGIQNCLATIQEKLSNAIEWQHSRDEKCEKIEDKLSEIETKILPGMATTLARQGVYIYIFSALLSAGIASFVMVLFKVVFKQ